MTAYLYPDKDLGLERQYYILNDSGQTTVGRHPFNDISILVASISRYHAVIHCNDGNYFLKDRHSSNGTLLNSHRIHTMKLLKEGDEVYFGHACFIFSFHPPGVFSAGTIRSTHDSNVHIVRDDGSSPATVISTKLEIPQIEKSLPSESTKSAESRASQRLAILYRLSSAKISETNIDDFLSLALGLVFESLPADRAAVLLCDAQSDFPKPVAVRRRDDLIKPIGAPDAINISRTMVQQCINQRLSILSRDTKADERFKNSESLLMSGVRTAMCVPLLTHDRVLGALFVDSADTVNCFGEEDLSFLASIGLDIAMTLSNIKLAQEIVRQARLATVGATIAGLSHNIKNVLQLAKGGLDLVQKALTEENFQSVKNYWPLLQKGVTRMTDLTQELLAFSAQNKPFLQPTDVNALITDLAESLKQTASDQLVAVQTDLAEGLPTYMLDSDSLSKSIMNLLTNAIDAMRGIPGVIILSTRKIDDGSLKIVVSDNGPGIPPNDLEHIWEPFFSTKGTRGTGLGLPMTLKYVQDMNGIIDIQTELGIGTSFFITFPPSSPDSSNTKEQ